MKLSLQIGRWDRHWNVTARWRSRYWNITIVEIRRLAVVYARQVDSVVEFANVLVREQSSDTIGLFAVQLDV